MLAYVAIKTPTHADAVVATLALLFCLPAVVWIAALLAQLRRRRPIHFIENVCGRCGYSLRGLPGIICPECGADTTKVGTRQPLRRRLRGTWLACALWVALMLGGSVIFRRDIEWYFLRLFWNVDYISLSSSPTRDYPTNALRQVATVVLMVAGVFTILRVSRWRGMRPRQSVEMNRLPSE